MFGKDAAELLQKIESVFTNAAAAIINTPEDVFSLFSRLRDFETDLKPIRGFLFEYIIGHLFHKEGWLIDINQVIATPEFEKAEIDVKAVQGQVLVSAECKGLAPESYLNTDIIDDWVQRQVPRIYDWHQKGIQTSYILQKEIEFHMYFSGNFDPDTRKYCNDIEARTKRYKIRFFDFTDIEIRLKKAGCDSALLRLNEFYHEKEEIISARKLISAIDLETIGS